MGEHSSAGLLSKSASAYEHLKRMAIRGLLRPGRRLSPADVAREFQISMTPVRDALVRLAAEGFIRAEPSRGYFTKAWTVEEQRDLHGVLMIHYVASLEAAAGADLARAIEALRALHAGSGEAAAGAEAYLDGLEALYRGMAEAGGNAATGRIVRNAAERTHLVRRLDLEDAGLRAAGAEALMRIAGAVGDGDLPRAIAESRAHLQALVSRLPEAVARANALAQQQRFP